MTGKNEYEFFYVYLVLSVFFISYNTKYNILKSLLILAHLLSLLVTKLTCIAKELLLLKRAKDSPILGKHRFTKFQRGLTRYLNIYRQFYIEQLTILFSGRLFVKYSIDCSAKWKRPITMEKKLVSASYLDNGRRFVLHQ